MATASTVPQVPERTPRPWAAMLLLAVVLTAHVIQSVATFSTTRALRDDDHPVLLVDHAIHLYHGALGSRFLHQRGTTWGYDPFFMAGYPETPVWDSSSNPSTLFQAIAGGGYHPRAYNIGLLVCSLLVVAAIPAGAAAAGLRLSETAVAALLAWFYFRCGWPDMFWRSGLFAFVTASGVSILLIGLLLYFERRPNAGRWAALTATGAALVFVHVTGPILASGTVLGCTATTLRRRFWRRFAAIALAGVFAIAANLFWLAPLWQFRGLRDARNFFMAPSSAWMVVEHYLERSVDGRFGLLVLPLGAVGLVAWLVDRQRVRAATFGGAVLVLLALTAFGGTWSVTRTLEPLRFKVPLHLVLTIPAASALVGGTSRLARGLGGGRRGAVIAAFAWIVLAGALAATQPWGLFAMVWDQMTIRRPMAAGIRPEMQHMVRWLRENTDPSARILFEDQLRLYEPTDPESTHWTPLLPIWLGRDKRQFVGGLYHLAFIANHRMASFGDFNLGDRPIDRWSPEEIRTYSDRYNVGWVVAWSPLSRFWFDRWGQARRIATLPRYVTRNRAGSSNQYEWQTLVRSAGPVAARRYMTEGDGQYAIYRIDRPHSFFLSGAGRLAEVDLNRIELADVVPDNGSVILSLHWLDTWRTEPRLEIAPVTFPGDPVPLVRISTSRAHERIVLYNSYGAP